MTDQVRTLRAMASQRNDIIALRPRRERAIAITGGKGGVGKSTLAVNLAVAYAKAGARCLTVDADLGMADLNLLLGVAPDYSLLDVMHGTDIDEVLVATHGIHLLPALNGSFALESMNGTDREHLFRALSGLRDRFDTLIVDIAAGIGENQSAFAASVPDVVVVVTSEPLSLADAYACLKVLASREKLRHAYVVPNRVRSPSEAEEVVARLSALVSRFLDVELTALPAVPFDASIASAASVGIPIVNYAPDSPASRAIRRLARRLDAFATPERRTNVVKTFWKNALPDKQDSEDC